MLSPADMIQVLSCSPKSKIKYRSLPRRPLGPYSAAVASDDPFHGRQTDTMPCKLLFSGDPMEWNEQLFRISHVKARSVIPDKVYRFLPHRRHPEFDDSFFLLGSKLPRVAEEVIQDRPQQVRIPVGTNPFGDQERDPAPRLGQFQLSSHLVRHRGEVNRFRARFHVGQAGEVEQGVDEPVHTQGAVVSLAEVPPALLV